MPTESRKENNGIPEPIFMIRNNCIELSSVSVDIERKDPLSLITSFGASSDPKDNEVLCLWCPLMCQNIVYSRILPCFCFSNATWFIVWPVEEVYSNGLTSQRCVGVKNLVIVWGKVFAFNFFRSVKKWVKYFFVRPYIIGNTRNYS